MRWPHLVRWAAGRPVLLRLADRLGRSRGRLRVVDAFAELPTPALKPDLTGWESHALAAAWLGHATVLLRVGGMTVLTDPVFSTRVGLGLGPFTGGPRRLVAPALAIHELPRIDLILISHAHFDHLDRPSLYRLPKHTPVVASARNGDLVRDLGFRQVSELNWGERTRVGSLTVEAVPVAHWGARTVADRHRGFAAFLLEADPSAGEGRPGSRVLYAGDTAFHEHFKRVGKVDLIVIGIGAYDPWIESHANPEQALAMADDAGADFILPMHYATFPLSREPREEPLARLLAAAGAGADRVVIRDIGGEWSKPPGSLGV